MGIFGDDAGSMKPGQVGIGNWAGESLLPDSSSPFTVRVPPSDPGAVARLEAENAALQAEVAALQAEVARLQAELGII